ncbi:MAG TPA: methylmalonyl-CoA mutase family protein, partial [Thermoanaerobaculia bacterium]|nr:methylmalonyl-CoA mutase family protein [Thermoanaerobaculia bacterium]
MTDRTPLTADFAPLGRSDWEAFARSSREALPPERLAGHTLDGIELRPVYFREDGLPDAASSSPGAPPFLRGATASGASRHGWDVRPVRAEATPEEWNRAVLDDLEGGATSIELRVAAPGTEGGLQMTGLEDLDRALVGVHLDAIGLGLDAGVSFAAASAAVVALLRRRGLDLREQRVSFGADPLGALARCGELPQGAVRAPGELAELAAFAAAEMPGATAARADGSPYHDAGASDAQELACVLATGVAYLRASTAGGLSVDPAFGQIEIAISLDTDLFGGIAKLRAARCLWSRVGEECGVTPDTAAAMRLQARAGRRMLSTRDPLLNVLRISAAAFAAAAGGARTITTPAFDELGATPSALGRRLARNAQLILAEEAHLYRVIDPAGGSWYVEHLTEELCEHAWDGFRELERRGGILAVLEDGSLARELAATATELERGVATRGTMLVGVNRFASLSAASTAQPHLGTVPAAPLPIASRPFPELVESWLSGAAPLGEELGEGRERSRTTVAKLGTRRTARPFEALRARADRWSEETGMRPRVFLAALGNPRDHAARVDWARDLL